MMLLVLLSVFAADDEVASLQASLKDGLPHVRAAAALRLGEIAGRAEAAVPDLVAAFSDTDTSVRYRAVEAALQIGRKSELLAPAFRKLMESPDAGDRIAGLQGLARISRDGKVIGAATTDVAKLLKDPHPLVRSAAIEGFRSLATGKNRPAEALAPLLEMAKDTDRVTRRAALGTLGVFVDDATVPPALLAALKDDDDRARAAAVGSLGSLGKDGKPHEAAVAALLKDPSREVRSRAASTLRAIDPEAAVKLVQTALRTGDGDVRASMAEPVSRWFPAEEADTTLTRMLRDGDTEVRYRTVLAISRMGRNRPTSAEFTFALSQVAVGDRNGVVRAAAEDAVRGKPLN